MRTIMPLDLFKLMQIAEVLMLDVRTKEEYEKVHINNSILIPLADIEEADINIIHNIMNKFEKKIICLTCRTDNRSKKAYEILKNFSFDNLFILKGGVTAWQENGFPVQISE